MIDATDPTETCDVSRSPNRSLRSRRSRVLPSRRSPSPSRNPTRNHSRSRHRNRIPRRLRPPADGAGRLLGGLRTGFA